MAPIGNVTCQPNNVTTEDPSNIGKDDLNALLYIVVTLLFYSMGIIIGIITYLKREQAEMEEDKMFDMYMQLKREPFNLYKRERVQQMALYLKQLEEQSAAREKIENWRTIEHSQMQAHIQRYQPCRRHAHRHFSCPDCNKTSPIAEICQGYDERTGLEAGWAESGGGTALLCSLTLGVCEPLLTPDSMKRLALPDLPKVDGKVLNSSTQGASILHSYPCLAAKSAFRHGSLTVHYADHAAALPKDLNSGNEYTQSVITSPPPETDFDSPSMFEKGDIELKELRQFNYDEVKAVFQKTSVPEGHNREVCDNLTFTQQIIPSRSKRSGSLTTTSGKLPKLFRQLSHDQDMKSCDFPTYAPLGNNFNLAVYKNIDNVHTSVDNSLVEDILLSQMETCAPVKDELKDNIPCCNTNSGDMCEGLQHSDEHQQEHVESQEQYYPLHEVPLTVTPSTATCFPGQKYELPLHFFVLTQQATTAGDVRPKVFFPVPLIPHTVFKDEAVSTCANSPNSTSPQTIPRVHSSTINSPVIHSSIVHNSGVHSSNVHSSCMNSPNSHNPMCDSWNTGISKNVDISDVTRARKLGLNWKSKTVDKKVAPRTQPERRGALFFTQRSLHKDVDNQKSASGRKYSRPTVFSRQESVDSHTSRTSEMSESLENPLLNPNSDVDSCIISSPSSSVGSNSMSPPATSKQAKRIPLLIRSQTVDNSKLLQH